MGLTPAEPTRWLTIARASERMEEKLSCLANVTRVSYLAADEHANSVRLAERAISVEVERFTSSVQPESASPLVAACHTVYDDLCIIDRGLHSPTLISGCVASPSYWRLADKVGRPLREVHAPARGLNEKLGTRIDDFFQRLPDERIFERRNWFIHTSERLYQDNPEPVEDFLGDPLYLRSERQTLRAFGRWVCFSIAVSTHPLTDIAHHSQALKTLTRALEGLSDNELEHFGGMDKRQAIMTRLDQSAKPD